MYLLIKNTLPLKNKSLAGYFALTLGINNFRDSERLFDINTHRPYIEKKKFQLTTDTYLCNKVNINMPVDNV